MSISRYRRNTPSEVRAFTLLEILVVVVILGIAGAMVIPSMGQTGILRVQAAVRQVVSDITFAQADAVAFQERRAVVFDPVNNRYTLVQVPGSVIDIDSNALYDPTRPGGRYIVHFSEDRYGGAELLSADFSGQTTLIFDALGGPVADASGNTPSSGGIIRIRGSGQTFRVRVEAFTGRVVVQREEN